MPGGANAVRYCKGTLIDLRSRPVVADGRRTRLELEQISSVGNAPTPDLYICYS